jgi:6-phosphogluconate dehydrogenase
LSKADIGLIGLGVMGRNLALNMADHGYHVAVHNRTQSVTDDFVGGFSGNDGGLTGCRSLAELVAAIRPPRPIVMMVKAGDPVDELLAAMRPHLEPGDIPIDAGNANFHNTIRRSASLKEAGFAYLGVGVSGGEEGARRGPSIMAGGPREAFQRVEPILNAIAADYDGEPCAAWLGADGAGHFVKSVHNGIEYAEMQLIAEICEIMRTGFAMRPADIGDVFKQWNTGELESYLVEITAEILTTEDPVNGGPIIDVIVDSAGQKGTGRWTAIEALQLGLPAPSIDAAVVARVISARKAERLTTEVLYQTIDRPSVNPFDRAAIAMLEGALLGGRIAMYAQGFVLMAGASQTYGWNLPLAGIARIWRAGCIIRSRLLNPIAAAFAETPDLPNLFNDTKLAGMMTRSHEAMRKTAVLALAQGIPAPALCSALAYFDSMRQGRSSAAMIQAQRDFFGAHGFRRTDRDGDHHGPWGGTDV